MKKNILFLTFLSFFLYASAQQDTTFNKLINTFSGSAGIMNILTMDDSYYCFVASRDTPNVSVQNYGLIKLNSNFVIIDSSIFSCDINLPLSGNRGHGLDINPQDSSLIFAGTLRYASTKENGYIVKFDKNLDTLWTMQIPHPDTACADTAATPWVALRDVKVTPSGDYIIVGNYNYHCQGNRNRSFIIKINSNGGIIWYRINPLFIASKINEIDIDPIDSGLCFVSYINPNMKFIKLDKNGNFIWSTSYINNPHPTIITNNSIFNNKIFIASANWDKTPSSNSKLLLSVSYINSQTHTLTWEKTFKSINIKSNWLNQETIDIEIMPNGNIAVGSVGMKYTGNIFIADTRAQILMLNPQGDSLWSRYYTYSDNSMGAEDMQFNDMVACPDGGLLFGGDRTHNTLFLDAWLVKTDSMGYAPHAYTVSIEQDELIITKNKIKLYPNPATNNINLRFEQNTKQNIQLRIYSASGALVKQQQLPAFAGEYRVDISGLKSGVYFIKLTSDNKTVFSSKFVKQ